MEKLGGVKRYCEATNKISQVEGNPRKGKGWKQTSGDRQEKPSAHQVLQWEGFLSLGISQANRKESTLASHLSTDPTYMFKPLQVLGGIEDKHDKI